MIAPDTRVTLDASGYAGSWSPFGDAWPSQVQSTIANALMSAGFNVTSVTLVTGTDSSIAAHQFPFRARLVITTEAAYNGYVNITADVRDALSSAIGSAVTVANITAGDAPQPDPSSLLPQLNLSIGLVAVVLVAAIILLHEL